jgi:pyruvate dehydrogenase E1 component
MVPEALTAAERLDALGVDSDVVCVTSPDLLFRASQARRGRDHSPTWILDAVLADRVPMVTVLDGHPHTLSFLGADRAAIHLGVTSFGQSGDLADVLRHHQIDAQAIVSAALDLLDDPNAESRAR